MALLRALTLTILFLCASLLSADWFIDVSRQALYPDVVEHLSQVFSLSGDLEEDCMAIQARFYRSDPLTFIQGGPICEELPLRTICQFLDESYQRRTDLITPPLKGEKVDAIICGGVKATLITRFQAVRKTLEAGWQVRRLHIIVQSREMEKEVYQVAQEVLGDWSSGLEIHPLLTHTSQEGRGRGLKLLRRRQKLGPRYIVIDSSSFFVDRLAVECRRFLSPHHELVGLQCYQIHDWRQEAQIHGYLDGFEDPERGIRAWFSSHMNFVARQLHYEFLHRLDLSEEEDRVVRVLKQAGGPQLKAPIIQLLEIQLEKGLTSPQNSVQGLQGFTRSLGLAHYLKALTGNPEGPLLSKISRSMERFLGYQPPSTQLIRHLEESRNTLFNSMGGYEQINHERETFLLDRLRTHLDHLGPAPCDYALIMLGSTARKEATPFSDVEVCWLLENDLTASRDYFQRLHLYLMLDLVSLGETLVPMLRIPSLEQDGECWFFDHLTKRGFSPDLLKGLTSDCLGTGVALIQNKWETGSFATSERLLAGSPRLFQQYEKDKLEFLSKRNTSPLWEECYGHAMLFEDKLDIKKGHFRPLTCILSRLNILLNLEAETSKERIDKLQKMEYISQQEWAVLGAYLETCLTFRLELHRSFHRQWDQIPVKAPGVPQLLHQQNVARQILLRLLDKHSGRRSSPYPT